MQAYVGRYLLIKLPANENETIAYYYRYCNHRITSRPSSDESSFFGARIPSTKLFVGTDSAAPVSAKVNIISEYTHVNECSKVGIFILCFFWSLAVK